VEIGGVKGDSLKLSYGAALQISWRQADVMMMRTGLTKDRDLAVVSQLSLYLLVSGPRPRMRP
jgi:hypothetical protein